MKFCSGCNFVGALKWHFMCLTVLLLLVDGVVKLPKPEVIIDL